MRLGEVPNLQRFSADWVRFAVATVLATRMEFLGLNGRPWNTRKAKTGS